MKEVKTCKTCEKVKSLTEFYTQNKHKADGTPYTYYNPECKSCTMARSYKWQGNEENRESYLKSMRKRNKKNAVKIKEANRIRGKDGTFREYQRKNKDKTKLYNFNRIMNKTHVITKDEWNECKSYFSGACAYCGISEEDAKVNYNNFLHKEHVEHDGSNGIENCVPSCKSCNSKKWKFKLEDWYNESNLIYSEARFKRIISWLNQFEEQIYHIQ